MDLPTPAPTSTLTSTPTSTPMPTVTNTLHLPALTPSQLASNLTCTAANTPVLSPLSASVMLMEAEPELDVRLVSPPNKVSGGRHYNLTCQASGSMPPPTLTWWLRGKKLKQKVITGVLEWFWCVLSSRVISRLVKGFHGCNTQF
ncbi:hypothetical protein Pcinc_027152 [Petrolisthes cinctipes]|uniref:Ig-like domain-containing protein n=1 Tax=Petrolisthes cinctipes TaxID=88211 RepID=A0AAE1KAN2_PETCI|nr:hypothetical protein Pcinc_027152 [Petrolisthes cinctipes]